MTQSTTDTHRHIHLENNVLFPAAIRIEAGEA
jgi:iron-sulfur cluster repair protein YtfE (RIC family)